MYVCVHVREREGGGRGGEAQIMNGKE